MIKGIIEKLFFSNKKKTEKKDFDWEHSQEVAKEQFKKLKDKGLSIPIVTL